MEDTVHFIDKRCPQCNATLLKDDDTGDVWCSLTGCDYGIYEDIKESDIQAHDLAKQVQSDLLWRQEG